jgi:hypothetical protein
MYYLRCHLPYNFDEDNGKSHINNFFILINIFYHAIFYNCGNVIIYIRNLISMDNNVLAYVKKLKIIIYFLTVELFEDHIHIYIAIVLN